MELKTSTRPSLLTALAIGSLVQGTVLFAEEPAECARGIAYALTNEGMFVYTEDEPSGQNSEGRLELLNDGQTVWSATTWRGCSLGISICNIVMPYALDDGTTGSIDFDMSFGKVRTENGESVCVTVMSQMGEQLGYLHKRYSDTTVRFDRGRSDAPALEMRDFMQSVPSVYQRCGCGGAAS